MIASAHVLAGFVCGLAAAPARASASRIAVAFGLGVASHLILDAIPHSDYGMLSRSAIGVAVLIEVTVAVGLAWVLLRSHTPAVWRTALPAGVVGATIPDIKFLAPLLPPSVRTRVEAFAESLHGPFHAAPQPLVTEVLIELAVTLVLLVVLIVLARNRVTHYMAAP